MLQIFLMTCCRSQPIPAPVVNIDVKPITFPVPIPPDNPDVTFIPVEDGLFLSLEDSKKLALWIVDINEHREIIMKILEYYNGE